MVKAIMLQLRWKKNCQNLYRFAFQIGTLNVGQQLTEDYLTI